jgi:hypothetical protein
MNSKDGLRRNLKRKQFGWFGRAAERSVRLPMILGLACRRWFDGLVGAVIGLAVMVSSRLHQTSQPS